METNKQQERDNKRIEDDAKFYLNKPGFFSCGHNPALLIEGIDEYGDFVSFCQACGY